MNTELFVNISKEKYGELYDYRLVDYKKSTEKVKIICSVHGVFEQTPQCHMRGGCKKCSFSKMGKNRRIGLDGFINKSNIKHGYKYDYSRVSLSVVSDIVEIICVKHGVFKQEANNHMMGTGCPKCNLPKRVDTSEFKIRALSVHGNKYDYSKTKVSSVRDIVEIICKTHGSFKQGVLVHLRGSGCQDCAKTSSFRRSSYVNICSKYKSKSRLYVIKCFDGEESFYKIGITCRSVKDRFYGSIPYRYKVMAVYFGDAGLVWDYEKKLFSILKADLYEPLKKFDGSTECFLNVDLEQIDSIVNGVLKKC